MSTTRESRIDEDDDPLDDSVPLGWRYLEELQPDGTVSYRQVPLTEADLLFPREDDHLVNDHVHAEVLGYLMAVLRARFAGVPGVVVLMDCRVVWTTPDVQPLGPDITVLFDVPGPLREVGGVDLTIDGGRPVLAVEIVSPGTRRIDLNEKVGLYQRAGVEWYVIIDRRRHARPSRLIGYRFADGRSRSVEPDADGRLWVVPLGVGFALLDGQVRLIDRATGEVCPDMTEALRAKQEADRRAEDERRRAEDERRRADEAVRQAAELQAELQRLRGETAARRIAELEAENKRLRGEPP